MYIIIFLLLTVISSDYYHEPAMLRTQSSWRTIGKGKKITVLQGRRVSERRKHGVDDGQAQLSDLHARYADWTKEKQAPYPQRGRSTGERVAIIKK